MRMTNVLMILKPIIKKPKPSKMANHCSNFIYVHGEGKKVKKLHDWWKKYLIDKYSEIQYLSDLPIFTREEKKQRDPYVVVGTRWIDTHWIDVDVKNGTCNIQCETAWSPCNELLRRLAEKFDVSVENQYEESGMDLYGEYKANGKTFRDQRADTFLHGVLKYDGYERFISEMEFVGDLSILESFKPVMKEEDYLELKSKITTNE